MTHRLIVLFAAATLALAAPMTYAHHKSGHVDAGAGNGSEWELIQMCDPITGECEPDPICVEVDPGKSGGRNRSPEPSTPPECGGGPQPT